MKNAWFIPVTLTVIIIIKYITLESVQNFEYLYNI